MRTAKRRRQPLGRIDCGALVYVFARANGTYGFVSIDKKIESWDKDMEKAWARFFTLARRAMKRANVVPPQVMNAPEPPMPEDDTAVASEVVPDGAIPTGTYNH